MAGSNRHKQSAPTHRNRLKSRYVLSIVVGLALGFALSFACLPLMSICDDSPSIFFEPFSSPLKKDSNSVVGSLRTKLDVFPIIKRQARSVADVTLVDYRSKDYEPRIHPFRRASLKSNDSNANVSNNNNKNKANAAQTHPPNQYSSVRPRYIADELRIREKVLVAVLAETDHLKTFGFFLNQSLESHVNRLLFFINDNINDFPKTMQVIAINDKRTYLKPFYVLKYLAEKLMKSYDWFFIIPDNTFVRGFKLNELLNHISIGQDLYMGQSLDDLHSVYCFYGSGIILSSSILQKVVSELDWCTRNAYSPDLTDNLGRCILKAAKSQCVHTVSHYNFSAYVNYRFEFDKDIDTLSKTEAFNQALTVHPVADMETMLKLQKYFNELEINETTEIIRKYEKTIEQLSCYAPEGCGNIPWPAGVPPPFKPTTRFDVLRWDYFNETHIYLKTDNHVIERLTGDDYDDIHEVIDHSVEQFKKTYGKELTYKKLLNGYRQFDPTRGTHYFIDIVLTDTNNTEYIKRAELMRPLGLVEIIPMPFITETTKLFLILPIHSNEQSASIRFLHYVNRTLFDRETRDKFELLLTHIVTTKEEYSQTQVWFENIRFIVDSIRQIHKQLAITYHTMLLPSTTIPLYSKPIHLLDFFQAKLRTNALIFITNPYVNIDADFLNRCRLNVIENIQIFFPIAFYQYHPHIIALSRNITDNTTIDLHKTVGWFNSYAYDHIGLYMSDYINMKKLIAHYNISISTTNLYDLFIQLAELHVLRAPDQSLRVYYRPIQCDTNLQSNPTEYDRCLMQQEKGLASRGQLAMIIIEDEQKTRATIKKDK